MIEAYAAELAARHRSEDDLARLRRCIDEGRAASAENDVVRAASLHRDFHVGVETAAGNPYLAIAVGPLRHQTELVFTVLQDSRALLSWDEHEAIWQAIEASDPALARKRTFAHMDSVSRDLRSHRRRSPA